MWTNDVECLGTSQAGHIPTSHEGVRGLAEWDLQVPIDPKWSQEAPAMLQKWPSEVPKNMYGFKNEL